MFHSLQCRCKKIDEVSQSLGAGKSEREVKESHLVGSSGWSLRVRLRQALTCNSFWGMCMFASGAGHGSHSVMELT